MLSKEYQVKAIRAIITSLNYLNELALGAIESKEFAIAKSKGIGNELTWLTGAWERGWVAVALLTPGWSSSRST